MLTCSMCSIDSDCVFNNPYKDNVNMKAPEKLYLSKNIYSTYLYQVPDPDDDSVVEYIRKDAFIEAVADWMSNNLQTVSEVKTPSAHHVESIPALGIITQTEFIEKFKKEIMFLIN